MCQTGHAVFQASCNDCRILKNEWYQYLAKSGFIDLEDKNEKLKLESFSDHRITDFQSEAVFGNKQSYYQWAGTKLNNARFDSVKDKLIWEYHSEGLSTRQISPRIGLEQSWTCRKINRIKQYLKDQIESIGSMTHAAAIA